MTEKEKKIPAKWVWCAALAVLGLILRLFCPGYGFSGLFFLGLAALFPVYHVIGKISNIPLKKGLSMTLTGLLAVFFTAAAITGCVIVTASRGAEKTESEYVIVLGAGVNGTVPSRSLRERLDAAYEYLVNHPENIAIVSGGQGSGEDITEAQCMFDYLTGKGISPDRIWMEDKATSTLENLRYSLDLIEEKTGVRPAKTAVLSSEYHLYRAKMFASWLDLEAEPVAAKTVVPPLRWNYYLREIFAVWYYSLFGGN
jgi:uncharacterized SAM-binding protein YcdF (DUF218 family)